jgi:hypothetical protein
MSVMLKHLQQYIAEGDVFLHHIVAGDEMWCHCSIPTGKPADSAVETCHHPMTKGVQIEGLKSCTFTSDDSVWEAMVQ